MYQLYIIVITTAQKNVDKLFWFAPKYTLCTDMAIANPYSV
jgi:hypothetical protein